MSPFKMDDLDVPAIITEYQRGDSLRTISQRHGVAFTTVRRRLIDSGVPLRTGRETAAIRAANPRARSQARGLKKNLDMPAIIAEYERGDSLPVVGRRHGVDAETIRLRLKDASVPIRSRREGMIARFYATGYLQGLAADLGVPEETVRTLLIKHGLIRQPPRGD